MGPLHMVCKVFYVDGDKLQEIGGMEWDSKPNSYLRQLHLYATTGILDLPKIPLRPGSVRIEREVVAKLDFMPEPER
jgi:hypothetical protein